MNTPHDAETSPSDNELQLLSVLWENGPATARELREAMPDGKPRSYTTVLSTLQLMEKKGLVTHTPRGRAHVYRPTHKRPRVLGPLVQRLVQRVFAGRPADVVQQLLESGQPVPPHELARMREMIDQAEAAAARPKRPRAGGKS